ncbi:hypothetical protein BGM09_35915 [Streptomyces sp. CBMA29]|nr:hypothetical protein [Streptomyces sp. CBMA29]
MVTALLVASASAAVVGCDGGSGTSHAANSPRAGTSASATMSATASATATATPSPSPSPSPTSPAYGKPGSTHTLAELARHPCLAVNEDDTGPAKLWIGIDGSESHASGDSPLSCQWGAVGGLVDFAPYTSADLTKDARFRNLTHESVSGHTARVGASSRDGSALMVVAVSPGRSFRLIVTSFGDTAPKGPGPVGLAEDFAQAIVSHLR